MCTKKSQLLDLARLRWICCSPVSRPYSSVCISDSHFTNNHQVDGHLYKPYCFEMKCYSINLVTVNYSVVTYFPMMIYRILLGVKREMSLWTIPDPILWVLILQVITPSKN